MLNKLYLENVNVQAFLLCRPKVQIWLESAWWLSPKLTCSWYSFNDVDTLTLIQRYIGAYRWKQGRKHASTRVYLDGNWWQNLMRRPWPIAHPCIAIKLPKFINSPIWQEFDEAMTDCISIRLEIINVHQFDKNLHTMSIAHVSTSAALV